MERVEGKWGRLWCGLGRRRRCGCSTYRLREWYCGLCTGWSRGGQKGKISWWIVTTSPYGDPIAEIPCNARHLYKVIHISESANTAKLVSAMELHHCLRHVSVASAHKLVQSSTVKGITLDPNTPEMDCKVCIYARATHVPMSKPRISVLSQNFRDKIHTDV